MAVEGSITLTNVLFGEKTFTATQQVCVDADAIADVLEGEQNIYTNEEDDKVKVGVDSSEAEDGQVLTANGDGTSSWQGFAAGITFADENDDGNISISGVESNG